LASSSPPNYPPELLWNGRQPDQTFGLDEALYYRVPAFDERGRVSPQDVTPCPDTSVNRSKYSQPEHVLYARFPRFLGHRVVQFRVRDIPPTLVSGDNEQLSFLIVHDPVMPPVEENENYAHSEIRAFLNGERTVKITNKVKREYRQILADAMNRELIQGQPPQPTAEAGV
jgi:hypothetical protein